MLRVVFKNLKKSELTQDLVSDRIQRALSKFPEFAHLNSSVIVSMENSPTQKGPDHFTVKFVMGGPGLKTLVVEKRAQTVYLAAALLADHLLEVLHRTLERQRDLSRSESRWLKRKSDFTNASSF